MAKFLSILLASIIIFYIVAVCAVYLLPRFDYQFVTVTYDDESLGLKNKDVVLTQPVKFEKLKENDIIAYSNNNGGISVRRLSSVSASSNIATVILKETELKDFTENIAASKIIGKKIITLKHCSTAIAFLGTYAGKMLCAIIGAVFLIARIAFGRRKGSM